jgi:hypothetical protein
MLHFLAGNISSLLEICSSLLEMTSLKIICLQNATDLRDSLKVSVSSCFTSSRLAPEPLPFQSGQALLDLVSEYGEPNRTPKSVVSRSRAGVLRQCMGSMCWTQATSLSRTLSTPTWIS